MISTANIDRYDDVRLGNLVILLALTGPWQVLLPQAGLKLQEPILLQALCRAATEAAPMAYYDEDQFQDWVRFPHLVGKAFRQSDLSTLNVDDLWSFYDWLENGMTSGVHDFPHRLFWYEACVWAWREDGLAKILHGRDFDHAFEFARTVAETVRSPSYSEARENLCQNHDNFADTFLKMKFHINFVPGVLISPPLIEIGYLRRAFILRKQTEAFVSQGRDVRPLETMARAYAELRQTSKYVVDYVADTDAFQVANLWSDRFQRQTA